MSYTYTRLGSQGEIHLSDNKKTTLCNLMCTQPNWYVIEAKEDKNPQMCVDCLAAKPKEDVKEKTTKKVTKKAAKKVTKKVEKEAPAKKGNETTKKTTKKATKKEDK